MRLKEAYKLNLNLSHPARDVSDFGVKPSNPDNSDAYAKAAEWFAAQDNPPCLVFGPGVYKAEEAPNWAKDHGTIITCGVVRLRNTGTGDSFILDGGAAGAGITDMQIGRFLIEGHNGSGDGVYMRGIHRSNVSFNVRGCGTTQAALRSEWCVVSEIRITASVNEGGWYNDGTGEAEPLYGVYLDERDPGEATSYCLFPNPILEGTGIGAYVDKAIGNNFDGGTMEGCVTYGLQLTANATTNKCTGADFEANGTGDILIQGDDNYITGVDSGFGGGGGGITITTGAKGNKIEGGSHSDITFDSGSTGNLASNLSVNRFGDGSGYADNGSNSKPIGVYDFGNDKWINSDVYLVAASVTDNVGGQTPVGTLSDTQTPLDGNEFNMPENNSDPAIDLDFGFTNIQQFRGVVFNARYTGSSNHYMTVAIRDYTAGVDRNLMNFSTTVTDNYRTVLIPDDSDFIDGSGNAQISFHHSPGNGNTSHDLFIDYIALLY